MFLCVSPSVSVSVRFMSECLLANITGIWLYSCVYYNVSSWYRTVSQCLFASRTGICHWVCESICMCSFKINISDQCQDFDRHWFALGIDLMSLTNRTRTGMFFRAPLRENVFWQTSQENAFSPVCIFMWSASLHFSLSFFQHIPQGKG